MAASAPSMPAAPPPWTLKGEVYTFPLWVSRGEAREMASSSSSSGGSSYYSPLEARSGYASTPLSRPVGGLGAVQVLRYHDSPVGPYDELVVLPGGFAWRREDEAGRVVAKGAALKITRIYVSQRETCYNGRIRTVHLPESWTKLTMHPFSQPSPDWNVPKHLARFDWDRQPDGTTTVKVFPHDADPSDESAPSAEPFFQATFRPLRLLPRFPLSTAWLRWLGRDPTLVHPPLPEGATAAELPGTGRRWCATAALLSGRRAALGWFDVRGPLAEEGEKNGPSSSPSSSLSSGGIPGGWRLGVWLEDAVLEFPVPETWEERASL